MLQVPVVHRSAQVPESLSTGSAHVLHGELLEFLIHPLLAVVLEPPALVRRSAVPELVTGSAHALPPDLLEGLIPPLLHPDPPLQALLPASFLKGPCRNVSIAGRASCCGTPVA